MKTGLLELANKMVSIRKRGHMRTKKENQEDKPRLLSPRSLARRSVLVLVTMRVPKGCQSGLDQRVKGRRELGVTHLVYSGDDGLLARSERRQRRPRRIAHVGRTLWEKATKVAKQKPLDPAGRPPVVVDELARLRCALLAGCERKAHLGCVWRAAWCDVAMSRFLLCWNRRAVVGLPELRSVAKKTFAGLVRCLLLVCCWESVINGAQTNSCEK